MRIIQDSGSGAIRARPILVEDKRGSFPKRRRSTIPRRSARNFFVLRTVLRTAWHCGSRNELYSRFCRDSSKSRPGRFSSRWFAGPHGDSITAFCRALKTGGAHTVLFFILNLNHAKGQKRESERKRESMSVRVCMSICICVYVEVR